MVSVKTSDNKLDYFRVENPSISEDHVILYSYEGSKLESLTEHDNIERSHLSLITDLHSHVLEISKVITLIKDILTTNKHYYNYTFQARYNEHSTD